MDKQALGRKRDLAIQSIVNVLTELGGAAEIPPFSPPGTARRFDSEHNSVINLEALADYAVQIRDHAAVPEYKAAVQQSNFEYDDFSVSGLKKLALARGLEIPTAPSRAELIALMDGESDDAEEHD